MSPLETLVLETCKDVKSLVSECVHEAVLSQNIEQITAISVNPIDYETYDQFQYDYRLAKLFSKSEFHKPLRDREINTIKKFLSVEKRLADYHRRMGVCEDPEIWDFHERVNDRLRYLTKDMDMAMVARYMRFGPGRTSSRESSKSVPLAKFTGPFSISLTCYNFLMEHLLEEHHPWLYNTLRSDQIVISRAALIDMVPKNAKALRPVTYEHDLDTFVQLGVNGAMACEILPKLGIYIRKYTQTIEREGFEFELPNENQPSLHHWLVLQASRDGQLATADLSSASDLKSRTLHEWQHKGTFYGAITLAVCNPLVNFKLLGHDQEFVTRKLGGMGNAVIFTDETLTFHVIIEETLKEMGIPKSIFYVRDMWNTTFGDDLIFPAQAYDEVCRRLTEWYPYILNSDKSFKVGKFRESCGEDAFDGISAWPLKITVDPSKVITGKAFQSKFEKLTLEIRKRNKQGRKVSPKWLVKEFNKLPLSNHEKEMIRETITIANGFHRMANSMPGFIDPIWHKCCKAVIKWLPEPLRYLSGPESLGSTALHNGKKYFFTEGYVRLCATIQETTDKGDFNGELLTYKNKKGRIVTTSVDAKAIMAYALSGGGSDFTSRCNRRRFAFKITEVVS